VTTEMIPTDELKDYRERLAKLVADKNFEITTVHSAIRYFHQTTEAEMSADQWEDVLELLEQNSASDLVDFIGTEADAASAAEATGVSVCAPDAHIQ
jgi:hypothetical protein